MIQNMSCASRSIQADRRPNIARTLLRATLLALCITHLGGCASLSGTFSRDGLASFGGGPEKAFIGTKLDGVLLGLAPSCLIKECGESFGMFLVIWPLALIDLPLSLVADTLMLPYTIHHDTQLKQAKTKPKKEPPAISPKETPILSPSPPAVPPSKLPGKFNPKYKPVEGDTLGLSPKQPANPAQKTA